LPENPEPDWMKYAKKLLVLMLLSAMSFPAVQAQQEIEWISFEEAMKRNQANPKKILIDIYTDWCGWCKRMDATTFADPVIAKLAKQHYHAVKFNAEQQEPIVINAKEYKFVPNGRRGYHELAAELLGGRMSYPTTVFLDENFNMIQAIPGYRAAPEFDQIARYFGSDAFKSTEWETYIATVYKSPFPPPPPPAESPQQPAQNQ